MNWRQFVEVKRGLYRIIKVSMGLIFVWKITRIIWCRHSIHIICTKLYLSTLIAVKYSPISKCVLIKCSWCKIGKAKITREKKKVYETSSTQIPNLNLFFFSLSLWQRKVSIQKFWHTHKRCRSNVEQFVFC